ncbi:PREDICTED: cytochrome P450 CYP749A22-like isoform X1 [Erythranthe guttata]|uniref:cytochrome P450 CYP749A22-like isoform X1 n=1 Tax=Erythranthe guttata TaxID=4155 RepID=UPI00064E05E6|nr:PREDICTED: cytochrome P450 CYP749A22-like isoform X1 [Erythranthe guttata]|eukprot:XP_012855254.1 PREDICTED: cytochrome P450 CYP749A22-like isoform X1 [Erythranthe guttata]
MSIGFLVFGLAILYFFSLLAKFLHRVWWAPLRTQYAMELQGIKGPSYKFVRGNTVEISSMKSNSMRGNMELNHDIFSRTMPHFYTWINIYGNFFLFFNVIVLIIRCCFYHWLTRHSFIKKKKKTGKVFYFWNGEKAELVITEPELVKEVLNKSESYSRTDPDKYMRKIIGDGIVASEGEKWVKLRKLANQAFHAENLKNMVPAMVESVEMMMKKWREEKTREVDISKEFTFMTSEMISKTAFGSSYSQGEKVFNMLRQLSIITGRNAYKTKIPVIR